MNIKANLVPEDQRLDCTNELFGNYWWLAIEPAIFNFAWQLSKQYTGGHWQFQRLSNGGFLMVPDADTYEVNSPNGWQGIMSAEAFGIVACMFAYSHLAFTDNLAELCSRHFHLLREYALDHAEVAAIMAAVD